MLFDRGQAQVACPRIQKEMTKQVKRSKDNNQVTKSELETPTDKKLMEVKKMIKGGIVI